LAFPLFVAFGAKYIYCFLYYVCEGVAMAEPPAQLNEQSDDPEIGQEVVAAPVITQAVPIAPDISKVNAVEPGIDEADAAPDISVNTGHLFLNAACLKIGMN
jgi:hypothetical protein